MKLHRILKDNRVIGLRYRLTDRNYVDFNKETFMDMGKYLTKGYTPTVSGEDIICEELSQILITKNYVQSVRPITNDNEFEQMLKGNIAVVMFMGTEYRHNESPFSNPYNVMFTSDNIYNYNNYKESNINTMILYENYYKSKVYIKAKDITELLGMNNEWLKSEHIEGQGQVCRFTNKFERYADVRSDKDVLIVAKKECIDLTNIFDIFHISNVNFAQAYHNKYYS